MRRFYKRYLIADPPLILVVHLKRFQQTSKTPFMSFSAGFKKLDDYVTFPECLDITPFLAPNKEDFGLPIKKFRQSGRARGRCMYRLYAVVVHIGNIVSTFASELIENLAEDAPIAGGALCGVYCFAAKGEPPWNHPGSRARGIHFDLLGKFIEERQVEQGREAREA
jgi:hypothetical protein